RARRGRASSPVNDKNLPLLPASLEHNIPKRNVCVRDDGSQPGSSQRQNGVILEQICLITSRNQRRAK
uniref:Uncharacterized protein n=1 Tax=Anopheles dirus TaxID=7168 RepID=A0A182NWA8_9DIPT